MALVEINLRKPALVEEVVNEDETGGSSTMGRAARRMGSRRQRGGGSMVRKLAMFGMVLALAGAVRAIQGRRSGGSMKQEGIEVPVQDGSSGKDSNGRRRILGIVLMVAGAVVAARRLRNSQRR